MFCFQFYHKHHDEVKNGDRTTRVNLQDEDNHCRQQAEYKNLYDEDTQRKQHAYNNQSAGRGEESQRSLRDVLRNEAYRNNDGYIPLKSLFVPRLEGKNIVVKIKEEDYQQGVKELIFCVVGKLSLQKGDLVLITLELKRKLVEIWNIDNFKLIPLGRGEYHVLLRTINYQSKVLT